MRAIRSVLPVYTFYCQAVEVDITPSSNRYGVGKERGDKGTNNNRPLSAQGLRKAVTINKGEPAESAT